jgi:hypothetical protein
MAPKFFRKLGSVPSQRDGGADLQDAQIPENRGRVPVSNPLLTVELSIVMGKRLCYGRNQTSRLVPQSQMLGVVVIRLTA